MQLPATTEPQSKLARLCYEHFKTTGSKKFAFTARSGDEMSFAEDAVPSLEERGYISDVSSNGPFYTFTIQDALISYMRQVES